MNSGSPLSPDLSMYGTLTRQRKKWKDNLQSECQEDVFVYHNAALKWAQATAGKTRLCKLPVTYCKMS